MDYFFFYITRFLHAQILTFQDPDKIGGQINYFIFRVDLLFLDFLLVLD
jgi:hypothetical protein